MTTIEFEWELFKQARQELYPSVPTTTTKKLGDFDCECGGSRIFGEDGLPVCPSCGVVVNQYIDESAEWVNGPSDDGTVVDKARCGPAKDLELFSEQWGASTIMATTGRPTPSQRRIARIAFHQSMNHRDRALYHAYKSFDEAVEQKLHLSEKTLRHAKIMYRKFNNEKLTRGAVRTGIKANCILYACKIDNIPRTTKEVAEAFGIPTKDVSRTTDLFRKVMLDEVEESDKQTSAGVTKPENVVIRMLNNFNFENKRKVTSACIKFSNKLSECVELMGKTPSSIAAVVILKVADGSISKQEISKRCSVSLPTLNKIEIIVNKYLEGLSV